MGGDFAGRGGLGCEEGWEGDVMRDEEGGGRRGGEEGGEEEEGEEERR